MKQYAFIKNSIVVNIAVFADDATNELFEQFKILHELDEIVLADEHPAAMVGGTWNGNIFVSPDGKIDEDFIIKDERVKMFMQKAQEMLSNQ